MHFSREFWTFVQNPMNRNDGFGQEFCKLSDFEFTKCKLSQVKLGTASGKLSQAESINASLS